MTPINRPHTLEERLTPTTVAARQEALVCKPTHPLFLPKKDLEKIAQAVASPDRQTQYALTANRERFAQIVAFSGVNKNEAYALAHDIPMFTREQDGEALYVAQRKELSAEASALMTNTTVRLRIAELRRPVVRKLQRKFSYDLQKALSQAESAYTIAFEDGDVAGMLGAITLQSKLAKLLSEEINVHHTHGLLDTTTTDVLLGIRDEIEKRKGRQLKIASSVTVDATPLTQGVPT